MQLILLSVFGTAFLFVLEFCGLYYERWVREPHLCGLASQPAPLEASQFLSLSEAANDADATTIVCVRSRRTNTPLREYEHA